MEARWSVISCMLLCRDTPTQIVKALQCALQCPQLTVYNAKNKMTGTSQAKQWVRQRLSGQSSWSGAPGTRSSAIQTEVNVHWHMRQGFHSVPCPGSWKKTWGWSPTSVRRDKASSHSRKRSAEPNAVQDERPCYPVLWQNSFQSQRIHLQCFKSLHCLQVRGCRGQCQVHPNREESGCAAGPCHYLHWEEGTTRFPETRPKVDCRVIHEPAAHQNFSMGSQELWQQVRVAARWGQLSHCLQDASILEGGDTWFLAQRHLAAAQPRSCTHGLRHLSAFEGAPLGKILLQDGPVTASHHDTVGQLGGGLCQDSLC